MERLKLLSKIYPFNSSMLITLKGVTKKETAQEQSEKGYLPVFKTWQKPVEFEPNSGHEPEDSIKIKYFEKFISDCRNAGIKLYLVNSPSYLKYTNRPEAFEIVKALAAKYDVKIFDFSTDSYFLANGNLFSDRTHLNDRGAHIFSEKLSSLIKEDLASVGK